MKTLGSVILILLISLILPLSVCSAATDDVKKVVGVIVEKSDSGDRVQIGNYLVTDIRTVVIKADGKPDKIGSTKDLFIGALVIAELTEKNKDGYWGASAVALILGSKQDKALADLSEDEQNVIRKTQESISGSGEQAAEEVKDVKPPSPSKGNLRLEKGVWVN